MAMTSAKGRMSMKRQQGRQGPIDLGSATLQTKGGPWGVDDYRGSLMVNGGGLSQD
jgi:hypothetical protein